MPLRRRGPCGINHTDSDSMQSKPSLHSILCVPTVYVAGFPKCGTTSLHEMLVSHPQIVRPYHKEFHLGRQLMRANSTGMRRGILIRYLNKIVDPQHLSIRDKRLLTIDSSASTVFEVPRSDDYRNREYCLVPLLHKHLNPKSKFIVIMRNPVERTWSGYWYFCARKHGLNKEALVKGPRMFHNIVSSTINNFKKCLATGESHFICAMMYKNVETTKNPCLSVRLGINLYYFHIVKWFSVFPRQQFLFVRTEELETSPLAVLNRVSSFLAIDSFPASQFNESHSNVNTHIPREGFEMMDETRELLTSFFRPYNKMLAHLLNDKKFLWHAQ